MRAATFPCRSSMLALLAVVAVGGCDSSNRLRVHPVRGEVTVGGQPAVGAKVFFHPADRLDDPTALRPLAEVEADGSFRLTTYMTMDGAPAGEYVVTITWPTAPGTDATAAGDRLKHAYANPKKSPLRATVEAKDNTLTPFHLQ